MQQKEIKFRMPEIINGKFTGWFYWGFCGEAEGEFIGPHSKYRQSPSFQYTGLKDKNGVEIYEGDIVKVPLPMGGFWGNVKQEKIGKVVYESDYGGYAVVWAYSRNQHHVLLDCDIAFEAAILGNIYETTNWDKQDG